MRSASQRLDEGSVRGDGNHDMLDEMPDMIEGISEEKAEVNDDMLLNLVKEAEQTGGSTKAINTSSSAVAPLTTVGDVESDYPDEEIAELDIENDEAMFEAEMEDESEVEMPF